MKAPSVAPTTATQVRMEVAGELWASAEEAGFGSPAVSLRRGCLSATVPRRSLSKRKADTLVVREAASTAYTWGFVVILSLHACRLRINDGLDRHARAQ